MIQPEEMVAQKLRFLRGALDLTQGEMAECLSIDRAEWVKYENGKDIPPFLVLISIKHRFLISLDALLDDKIPMQRYYLSQIKKNPVILGRCIFMEHPSQSEVRREYESSAKLFEQELVQGENKTAD